MMTRKIIAAESKTSKSEKFDEKLPRLLPIVYRD